jgi:cytochrome c
MEDNYPDPLAGDKSVVQLAQRIHETMPDDADRKCTVDDAAKVAAYIYDAFYSADARARV